MRTTRTLMGMHVTVEIVGDDDLRMAAGIEAVFDLLAKVDQKFSTYKETSEITAINRKKLSEGEWSAEMREIFALAEKTKQDTAGYFDILTPEGDYDPSGVVKGWAIHRSAELLRNLGFKDFYVDAGGDIEAEGLNSEGEAWKIGIKNPFKSTEIVKTIHLQKGGVATSGTYERGQHIYDPHTNGRAPLTELVSLTVVGPDVLEADRFATAAFAMGEKGIYFIEGLPGLEGYGIDNKGQATMTSGFALYCA